MSLDHEPDLTNLPTPEPTDPQGLGSAENAMAPDQPTAEFPSVDIPEPAATNTPGDPNQRLAAPVESEEANPAGKPVKERKLLKPILAAVTTLGLLAGGALYATNSQDSENSAAKTEQETTTEAAQTPQIDQADISFGTLLTNIKEAVVEVRSPQQRSEAEKNKDLNEWASTTSRKITTSISNGKPVDVAFGTCVSFSKTYRYQDNGSEQIDVREFFIEPIVVHEGGRTLYYVEEPDGSSFVVTETLPDGSTRHSSGLPGLEIDELDSAQTKSVIVSQPDENVHFDQYTIKGTYFSGQLTENMAHGVPFGEVLTVTNANSLNNDAQQRKQLCADYIRKYNSTN